MSAGPLKGTSGIGSASLKQLQDSWSVKFGNCAVCQMVELCLCESKTTDMCSFCQQHNVIYIYICSPICVIVSLFYLVLLAHLSMLTRRKQTINGMRFCCFQIYVSLLYTQIYIYIYIYMCVCACYHIIYIYTCINTMLIVFYSSYWCCFYVRLYRYNYAILACTDEDAVCTCGRNIPWFCNLVVVTQLLAWSIWAAGVCDDRSRPPTESKQNSHNNYGLW